MNKEERKGQWRKIAVTAVAAALLLLLYSIIFRFSAQDAEESGSISQFFSEKCVQILDTLSGASWSDGKMTELAMFFEHPIRKLAHFSEYACMGILVYVLWSQWMRRGRRLYALTAIWIFLSACCDEFHQYFVPGRYASFADVLLDTCGGVFGMLLCICTTALYRRFSKRNRRKQMAKETATQASSK